jgi:hypothetical protein
LLRERVMLQADFQDVQPHVIETANKTGDVVTVVTVYKWDRRKHSANDGMLRGDMIAHVTATCLVDMLAVELTVLRARSYRRPLHIKVHGSAGHFLPRAAGRDAP